MATETEQKRNQLIAREQNRGTRQGAINANCIGCVYDPQESGTWRQQVDNCRITGCPLYGFRPRPHSPRV